MSSGLNLHFTRRHTSFAITAVYFVIKKSSSVNMTCCIDDIMRGNRNHTTQTLQCIRARSFFGVKILLEMSHRLMVDILFTKETILRPLLTHSRCKSSVFSLDGGTVTQSVDDYSSDEFPLSDCETDLQGGRGGGGGGRRGGGGCDGGNRSF